MSSNQDEETPETETPEAEKHEDSKPVVEPVHTNGTDHDLVVEIKARVEQLETMLTDIIHKGTNDSSPVRKPWTHRGGN